MTKSVFDFIILVQNFGGLPQKIKGEEHMARFQTTLSGRRLQRQISPKRIKIFKIGRDFSRARQKIAVNFGWSTIHKSDPLKLIISKDRISVFRG